MPLTPHVEKHFTSSESVRDIVIGMSMLTVPFALAAGFITPSRGFERYHCHGGARRSCGRGNRHGVGRLSSCANRCRAFRF